MTKVKNYQKYFKLQMIRFTIDGKSDFDTIFVSQEDQGVQQNLNSLQTHLCSLDKISSFKFDILIYAGETTDNSLFF